MRYLRAVLTPSGANVHPMHEFVCERDGFGDYRLLHWNPATDSAVAFVFHLRGDLATYEAALQDVESVEEYDLTPGNGDAFYVYVRERLSGADRDLVEAFTRASLVVVPPVEYRTDGTIHVTVVGPAERLQTALEAAPSGVDVDVRGVGRYRADVLAARERLTDRQFEAVTAAVEAGYYETPREASVADVAAALDCAPGTAAEHLRKAEAVLTSAAVER